MCKSIICFVCCFFIFPSIYAQLSASDVDSLERALSLHTADDEEKLNMLSTLASRLSTSDPEKGLAYAQQLIDLSKKIEHQPSLGKGYAILADNYGILGQDSLAIEGYAKAEEIFRDLEDEVAVAKV